MRTFKITVNGKVFHAMVETSGESGLSVSSIQPVPVACPGAKQPACADFRPSAAHESGSAAGSAVMKSPLPGKVLRIAAAPGKRFRKGETLLIIEAMKMENEILASRDCTVVGVDVQVNQSVRTGETLLRLE